jgi:hypothetical protein
MEDANVPLREARSLQLGDRLAELGSGIEPRRDDRGHCTSYVLIAMVETACARTVTRVLRPPAAIAE